MTTTTTYLIAQAEDETRPEIEQDQGGIPPAASTGDLVFTTKDWGCS